MKDVKLQPFQLMCGNDVVSNWLITTREYGRFMLDYFNESICNLELFLKETKDGEPLLTYHPGTRIGQFFDNANFNQSKYLSTYFRLDSVVLDRLYKYGLSKPSDFNFITLQGEGRQKLLRTYTPEQIELYIKSRIDKKFDVNSVILHPRVIKVRKCDLKKVIAPKVDKSKKTLFSNDNTVPMTVSDIEKALGHKVSIIS